MSKWTARYTDEQRAAIEHAHLENHRKVADIVRMAAAGELKHNGETLDAFEIPYQSASHIAKRAKRAREGNARSSLAALPPRDAIDELRRRLLSMADHETKRVQAQLNARKPTPMDAELLRKLARATREIAALPTPDQARTPLAAGQYTPGAGRDNRAPDTPTTRDNLAGAILKAQHTDLALAPGAAQSTPVPIPHG